MSEIDDRLPDDRLPDEVLVAYLDGELSPEERARVEHVLAADPETAERLDQHRRVDAALDRLPGLRASPGFAARVESAVRADLASGRPRLWVLRPGPLAAAAALLIAAGAWWGFGRGPTGGTDVLTAQEEQEIAQDLLLLSSLDVLELAEAEELAELADDLDVIDALGPEAPIELGEPEDG